MNGFLKIIFIILLLLYALFPFDIIPDGIPFLGWIDDALLVWIVVTYIKKGRLPGFMFWRQPGSGQYAGQTGQGTQSRGDKGSNDQKSESKSEPDDPYTILGIKPGASQEEIQSAYRKSVQMYHPDKVSHLGKEFQEIAAKKFIEIQAAYEKLKI